eukprot:6192002-Pleurochrysis_carterae.AAC.2
MAFFSVLPVKALDKGYAKGGPSHKHRLVQASVEPPHLHSSITRQSSEIHRARAAERCHSACVASPKQLLHALALAHVRVSG